MTTNKPLTAQQRWRLIQQANDRLKRNAKQRPELVYKIFANDSSVPRLVKALKARYLVSPKRISVTRGGVVTLSFRGPDYIKIADFCHGFGDGYHAAVMDGIDRDHAAALAAIDRKRRQARTPKVR